MPIFRSLVLLIPLCLAGCFFSGSKPEPEPVKPVPVLVQPVVQKPRPKIALALGGGAARGFAHIGVIKALETNGIVPDIIVGTSAGSVVGALYAAGNDAFALQKQAFQLDESALTDWAIFERGFVKGEALEKFINQQVAGKPIEGLKRKFAVVATDLADGQPAVFTAGNVGTAVRASSSIPAVFSPVLIRGREYVDGGLTSPIPVRAARQLGADIVIAVDISGRPSGKRNQGSVDLMLDTIAIMGTTIGAFELRDADIVIHPDTNGLPAANFQQRHEAILRGEQAGFAAIPKIKEKIAARSQ
ncbi:patatin-like phospholipase family protein [Uliginosibacterium sp. 31-16]|uniref:patatin-like phospholipase family protein n=1 Tax=Uliginosibacterium sp. 31-16 TaxID=3068315 RepID=UPI00273E713F|nr:patatin-like phospholipase family protein [Uliginosibacterium sp. 31-16]MDP5238115.1 patatin-like phospholipase family protein [Uliginosibacterium sp. 31-16]